MMICVCQQDAGRIVGDDSPKCCSKVSRRASIRRFSVSQRGFARGVRFGSRSFGCSPVLRNLRLGGLAAGDILCDPHKPTERIV